MLIAECGLRIADCEMEIGSVRDKPDQNSKSTCELTRFLHLWGIEILRSMAITFQYHDLRGSTQDSTFRNPHSAIRILQSAIRNPQSTFRNPHSAIRIPQSNES
jgi:hypothetical protein